MLTMAKIQELLKDHEYLEDITVSYEAFRELDRDMRRTVRFPSEDLRGEQVIKFMRYETEVTIRQGKKPGCRSCGRDYE